MKIAITSTGNSLESNIDQRFGRCAYFVIYNTENLFQIQTRIKKQVQAQQLFNL